MAKNKQQPKKKVHPEFISSTRLTRYVDEDQREHDDRPAPAAFLPNPSEEVDDANWHLSVNSLDIERLSAIAAYYQAVFAPNSIAVCIHSANQYRQAASKVGVGTSWHGPNNRFEFVDRDMKARAAFRHRPNPRHGDRPASPSHCGVEFVRTMNELSMRSFARRLSRSRFHKVGD